MPLLNLARIIQNICGTLLLEVFFRQENYVIYGHTLFSTNNHIIKLILSFLLPSISDLNDFSLFPKVK